MLTLFYRKIVSLAAGVSRHLAGQKKIANGLFVKFSAQINLIQFWTKRSKARKNTTFLTNVAFKVDSITEASVDVDVNSDTDADADVDPDVVTDTEAASRVESNMTSITFFCKIEFDQDRFHCLEDNGNEQNSY